MPTDIDEIIAVSKIPTEVVLVTLLELELAGKIERYPGNKLLWYLIANNTLMPIPNSKSKDKL